MGSLRPARGRSYAGNVRTTRLRSASPGGRFDLLAAVGPENEPADSQTWRQLAEQRETQSRSAHRIAELAASSGNTVGIMRKTDSRQGIAAGPSDRQPEGGPLPDLALYERLIDDGIVAADGRGSTVDHLTARRLAIWLAARPQEQVFALGLDRSPRPA